LVHKVYLFYDKFIFKNYIYRKFSNIEEQNNWFFASDKLLLKELVLREICPANRRKMEITITTKGLDLLAQLDPLIESHEHKFANNLTVNELEDFNVLLEKFRN
jgi:hypothetical protein